jgi:hypothetical protein
MAEITVPALVSTIKAHLAKGVQSKEKSEQHYISAGLHLKELKARKPSETPWPEYVRETFDLGRERADELIRIADGRTSVEKVRAGGATRAAKNIAKLKSGVSNTGSASASLEDSHATEAHQVAVADTPADAVKAAADRSVAKTPKPVLDVAPAADRAEAKSNPATSKPPVTEPAPMMGIDLMDIVQFLGSIHLGDARMTNDERIDMLAQIVRANAWLNKSAIEIAKAGGASLGKLAPVTLRLDALKFLKAAAARIEAELAGRAAPTADSKPAET